MYTQAITSSYGQFEKIEDKGLLANRNRLNEHEERLTAGGFHKGGTVFAEPPGGKRQVRSLYCDCACRFPISTPDERGKLCE
jgi:hypothetical protein